MSPSDGAASDPKTNFLTGAGPAVILWVTVVLALGYGVVKTVETALALFAG